MVSPLILNNLIITYHFFYLCQRIVILLNIFLISLRQKISWHQKILQLKNIKLDETTKVTKKSTMQNGIINIKNI